MSTCAQHPDVIASYTCGRCQTPVCGGCCYTMPDGSICCKTCYSKPAEEPAAAPPSLRVPSLRLAAHEPLGRTLVPDVAPLPGQGCVQHPNVMPVARCENCGARSCRTCDFAFPGNLHFCPVCIASAGSKISPRRKRYMITAYILAGWCTVGLVAFFGASMTGIAETEAAAMLLGIALMLVVGLPSLIGTAFGMSARRAGTTTPASVWVALIWNSLLFSGFALLIIIGAFSE